MSYQQSRRTNDYYVSPRHPLSQNYKLQAIPFENGSYANDPFVVISNNDSITFKFQTGSIKNNGVNGCHIDRLVQFAKHYLEVYNAGSGRCRENSNAILKLTEALHWLNQRVAEKYVNDHNGPLTLYTRNAVDNDIKHIDE